MCLPDPVTMGDGLAVRITRTPGPRVLWLHGYTLDSSIWSDTCGRLPGWSHVAADLPGHGASRDLAVGEDLPTLARQLVEIACSLDVVHVVGLSFGSMVALQMAVEAPRAFKSLTLAAPILGGGPQPPEVAGRHRELEQQHRAGASPESMRTLWMTSPPDLFTGSMRDPALHRRLCDVIDRHRWRELATGAFYSLVAHTQTKADLQRVRASTLILIGERELDAFKRCGELIRRAVPACRRVYLRDTGHLCLLESPGQASPFLEAHFAATQ